MSEYMVGVDIGGTCTDCVLIDADGRATLGKAFSTPPNFQDGILDAIGVAAAEIGLDTDALLQQTRLFLHSTTVAENAINDRNLVPVGLITSRGYQDTLFATRGGFGRWSGLTEDEKRNPTETDKPDQLVPLERIISVRERTDKFGDVLFDIDEAEVEAAVRKLTGAGAQAIGVCFLWSFNNPASEEKVGKIVRNAAPDVFLSLSHDIAPNLGEYERTSTVALNAGLGPIAISYLRGLADELRSHGFGGQFLVMQAWGGLLPEDVAAERPVGMIESGPVSGLMGCLNLGELTGTSNIINADMGGTTFKVGVVREGLIEYQAEALAFRYHYALPKIDVVSLGLAGGSIVSIDPRTGTPKIGPQSAGSYPGPVCYDHGGERPTITDVDAVLGYLNPDYFLGGRSSLDIAKAEDVFARDVAAALDLAPQEAAAAVYRLANSLIYDFLHEMTVQRGLDPRRFTLYSTGGTAGMHLPAVGSDLGLSSIVIPYTASVHGAFGLVTSDVVHEELVTRPMLHPGDPAQVQEVLDELDERVLEHLTKEGFGADDIDLVHSIDMRYARQVHEVTAPMPRGQITADALEDTVDTFETLYKQKYGEESTYREAGIEYITFRVRALGRVNKPDLDQWTTRRETAEQARVETRSIVLPGRQTPTDVSAYDFEDLEPGTSVEGPALIWSPITTVVLHEGHSAAIDAFRSIVITAKETPL